MLLKRFISTLVLLSTLLLANHGWAAESPHQVIDKATKALIGEIVEAKSYYETEPERFYQAVDRIIGSFIDFRSFTRSVMGEYGKKDYYKSLTKAEKATYRQEFKKFEQVFRTGLVETYSKGLLVFDGQKLEVQAADDEAKALIAEGKPVTVVQLLYGNSGNIYQLNYKMMLNKKRQQWLVRNVTIGSVNIGEVYFGQFDAAMKKQKGDLAAVVANWRVSDQEFSEDDAKVGEVKTAG